MTEKESAHPLSPSVDVDVEKENHESSVEDEEDLMNSTKNSVVPVSTQYE